MKIKLIVLSLSLVSAVASAKNCEPHIRYEYEKRHNRILYVELQHADATKAIYNVRGNYYGGDFLEEVTANAKTCVMLERKTIWAE